MKTLRVVLATLLVSLGTMASVWAVQRKEPAWKGSIRVDFKKLASRAKVSMADAEKAALASVEGGDADKKVVGRELVTENDALVYEIMVAVGGKKHEVEVDAGTGKVLGQNEQGSIKLGLARMAKISKDRAERIALGAVEGRDADKSLGDSELEVERDYLVYEIDVKVKGKPGMWEVIVDAGNGKVLATEHETGNGD
jgi:uncharacterized membrane protein YkoI